MTESYDFEDPTVIEPIPALHVGATSPDESGVRPCWDSIEIDVTELAAKEPSGPTAIDVDLSELERELVRAAAPEDPAGWQAEAAPSFAPVRLEAAIAPSSDSNFYRDLDGKLGVFVATYDAAAHSLPVGGRVWLSVHLPEGVCIESLARVEWSRGDDDGGWPGVGVRMLSLDERDHLAIVRFTRQREPLFY